MTESGGTGATGGGSQPADSGSSAEGGGAPPPDHTARGTSGDLPRWQPFADTPTAPPATMTPPTAMPDESALTPTPDTDVGSLVPDPLHDTPVYVPPPMGMSAGSLMPPPNPEDVPTSAWITTAPQTAPKSGGLSSRLGAVIGGIVALLLVAGFAANALGLLPNDKGKILFGTAAGSDLCSVGGQTLTAKSTDPIFFAAVLRHHLDGSQAITFKIDKNGAPLVNHEEPADGTSFDCYGNKESLGALDAGTYVFTVVHNGEVEATGTLTVQ